VSNSVAAWLSLAAAVWPSSWEWQVLAGGDWWRHSVALPRWDQRLGPPGAFWSTSMF